MSIADVAVKITLIDLMSRGLSGIGKRMKSLAASGRETQRAFDHMVKAGKGAGIAGVTTAALARGLRPAVGAASDLQAELIGTRAELSRMGKDAGTLNHEMGQVKKTAFSVQAWTPFDMGQIVALEKGLTKAGAEINSVSGEKGAAAAAAALAVYEKMEPLTAGKALIGIGTPFKIAADGYMGLADDISRAASASTVGAAEIAEGAKYAAGPMANLGKSSKEMLALSAMMAQVGVTGSMSGTALKNFFLKAAEHKVFHDAKGNLKSTADIIDILRKKLGKMGTAKQTKILKKLFGEEGMPVAVAMLNQGLGSYEAITEAIHNAAPLQDKLNRSMEGLSNQWMSLRGTSKSTLANLYLPALKPLTAVLKKTNELVAAIGKAAVGGNGLAKAVSGLSLGAVGVGGLTTVGLGAGALYYGRKVLKGTGGIRGLFKGAGDTATGIAKGKAVEAATGVRPVFITNWPADFGTGASGAIGVTGGKGAKGPLRRLAKAGGIKGLLKLAPGAAGLVPTAGAALGSLAVGAGIGLLIERGIAALVKWGTDGKAEDLGHLLYNRETRKQTPEEIEERYGAMSQMFDVTGGGVPEVKNEVNIALRVDRNNRVFAESGDPNTRANIDVPRGTF